MIMEGQAEDIGILGCVWRCCLSQKSAYLMKDCGM